MTRHESEWHPQPGENSETLRPTDLVLPEEIDKIWVGMFNQVYANRNMGTIIEADLCLRQKLEYGRLPATGQKNYETVYLLSSSGVVEHIVGGTVIRAIIRGESDPWSREIEYEPYLVLEDAEVLTMDDPITSYPEQQLLVPISGLRQLTLMTEGI